MILAMFRTQPHVDPSSAPLSSEVALNRDPVTTQVASPDVGSDRVPAYPTTAAPPSIIYPRYVIPMPKCF